MSTKNRQYMYNKLVEEGRIKDIVPRLIKEFGDPSKAAEVKSKAEEAKLRIKAEEAEKKKKAEEAHNN